MVVRVPVLGVEEAWFQVEPVVELDQPVDFPTGGTAPLGEDPSEFLLDRGPAPFRVVIPPNDVKGISPVDKTGERVKSGEVRGELPLTR